MPKWLDGVKETRACKTSPGKQTTNCQFLERRRPPSVAGPICEPPSSRVPLLGRPSVLNNRPVGVRVLCRRRRRRRPVDFGPTQSGPKRASERLLIHYLTFGAGGPPRGAVRFSALANPVGQFGSCRRPQSGRGSQFNFSNRPPPDVSDGWDSHRAGRRRMQIVVVVAAAAGEVSARVDSDLHVSRAPRWPASSGERPDLAAAANRNPARREFCNWRRVVVAVAVVLRVQETSSLASLARRLALLSDDSDWIELT
jgi:hypothetical protein